MNTGTGRGLTLRGRGPKESNLKAVVSPRQGRIQTVTHDAQLRALRIGSVAFGDSSTPTRHTKWLRLDWVHGVTVSAHRGVRG